jgi:predicted RNA polymerase sigma factor
MSENPTHSYIKQALADNGIVELRHQDGGRWTSGLFDNADELLDCARALHKYGNLFVSLNRPSPRMATNRMNGERLGNDDYQWVTRLFFGLFRTKCG